MGKQLKVNMSTNFSKRRQILHFILVGKKDGNNLRQKCYVHYCYRIFIFLNLVKNEKADFLEKDGNGIVVYCCSNLQIEAMKIENHLNIRPFEF